jgi:hypothetical protein
LASASLFLEDGPESSHRPCHPPHGRNGNQNTRRAGQSEDNHPIHGTTCDRFYWLLIDVKYSRQSRPGIPGLDPRLSGTFLA